MAGGDIVVLGRLADAYGMQGWLRLYPFADDPLAWGEMPVWWVGAEGGPWREYDLKALKAHGEGLVVLLDGVPDRTAAEAMKGLLVGAPRAALPKTEEGEFYWVDLVGLDVIGRGNTERTLRGDLVALDRLGQKKNGGFYDYDENRKATPSAVAAQVIADLAAHKGVEPTGSLSPEKILERLLFIVVNEGAKVLEEGIAIRASDIDVALILGYNWPLFTGGPMFWADSIGLGRIVDGLKAQGIAPAKLLVEKAAKGEKLTA